MADITLSFEDGTEHRYTGVPDDTTPDAVIERAGRDFSGKPIKHVARSLNPTPSPSPETGDGYLTTLAKDMGKMWGQGSGNTVRGIGKFLQAPAASTLEALTGLTAAISDEDHKPARQSLAQDVSRFAQEERESNLASGNAFADLGAKAEGLGKGAQEYYREVSPEMRAQQKEVSDATGFIGKTKALLTNPRALSGTVLQSAPDMAIGMGAGRVAGAIGKTQAASEALAAKTGMFTEAAQSAMSNSAGVEDRVGQMEHETLYKTNPYYKSLVDNGMSINEARGILGRSLGAEAAAMSGLGTFAGSKLTGAWDAMGKTVMGAGPLTAKEFGKRTFKEGAEEAVQNPLEGYATHKAMAQADPTDTYDLGGQIAEGLFTGTPMGAVSHGAPYVAERVRDARTDGYKIGRELERIVNSAMLGMPSQEAIAEGSVAQPPMPKGAPEADKPFAKRVIDKRESPESLPEQHDLYFKMDGATVMPISQLDSTKSEEENQQGGDNGPKRMAAAAAGELGKRDPITVMPSETEGRFDVVDGNGTLTSVKKYGWQNMPVNVVSREQGLAMIEADHAKEAAKSKGENPLVDPNQGLGAPIQTLNQGDGVPVAPLNADLHDALRQAGHRVASTGRLFGAPISVVNHADLVRFRNRLDQLAKEGEGGRLWYEESGKAVLDLAEGDKDMAEKLVGLFAIYSPNAPVSGNTTLALKAYSEYMDSGKITTISKMGKAVAEKAQAWMDGTLAEDSVTGIKRGNFYRNLMREIDPERMGEDAQGTTVDMHIARAGGYYKAKISSGVGEDSSGEYQFMDREVKRVAAALGWEPQQAQAAIWVAIKSRVDQVYDAIRDEAVANGWLKKVVKTNRYGKDSISYKPASMDGGHSFEKALLDAAMELPPSEVDSYSFADAIRERTAQISWETRPGETTGVLPGIHDSPLGQQAEYLQAVDSALRDENGQDIIAKKIGLPGSNTFFAPSAWQGKVAWGAQTETALATDRPKQSRIEAHAPAAHLLSIYSAIRGYVLNQEAVVWHFPNYTSSIKDANGVDVDWGRPLTVEEMDAVYRAFIAQAGHEEWAPAATRTGIRVLNFTETPNKEFHSKIRAALESLHGALDGWEFTRFGSIGDYISNDWKESPNGEGYRQRIGESRIPDLQEWADGVRSKVAEINRQFAERYGWDQPTQGQGRPLQTLNQGRGQPVSELGLSDVIPQDVQDHVKSLLDLAHPIQKAKLPNDVMVRATLMLKPQVASAAKNKPAFDKMLGDVAYAVGGIPMTAEIKGAERSAVKLVEDYNFDTSKMMDLLRGTILVRNEAEARRAAEQIKGMMKLAREPKDRFAKPTPEGYRDIMLNPVMPDGHVAEILIMTPEMNAAKKLAHKLYDHLRADQEPMPWRVKANLASKMVYGLAHARTSSENSASDTGMPLWAADAGGKVRAVGSKAMALSQSGDNATGTSSTSSRVQPSASSSSGVMGASSYRESLAQGGTPMGDGGLQQAGARFIYAPLQLSDSGAGFISQYRPKLDERSMARRGLEPLEPKQATVIDRALGDLFAAGVPRSWAERATFYAFKPGMNGLANYNPVDQAIGVQGAAMNAAANGDELSQRFVRGWLAHELHHLIDNYKTTNNDMYYLSVESPRMEILFDGNSLVPRGDLAREVVAKWLSLPEDNDIRLFLNYPLAQAGAMVEEDDAAAIFFAKVEIFAQMGAMYSTNPELVKAEFPAWSQFFEEWKDARGTEQQGSFDRSRVALRNLLQKPVPRSGDQGRGRGEGQPAGPVGQNQQRPVLTTARPGVGTDASGSGNRGGPPVLPAAPQAATGQSALGVYRDLSKAKIPDDNHIPTHVNYSTFNSANELKKVYAGLSEKYEAEIQAQRRGTVSHKESYRDARKLIEDESGISARKVDSLLKRDPGTPAGAAEILARMAILESETAKVEAMAKKIEQQGSLQTSEQEWLDFAAQLDRAAMAHQTFLGARAEIGRALNAIKGFSGMPYDGKQIQSVLDTYKGTDGLGKVATAIAQTARQDTQRGRGNAIGRLAKAASKATVTDAVIELWKAGLLSGPTTHLANLISNALFTMMRLPEQAVAGTVGALHGGKSAHLGETVALALGMGHGVAQGFRAAMRIMADEDASFGNTPTEEHQHAISGDTFGASGRLGAVIDYLGKAVRLPFRMLSAEDAVFKMVNMYGSLYAGALRTALDEGGKYWDKGFSHRVSELVKEGEQIMLDPAGALGPTAVSETGRKIGMEAVADGLTYTFQNRLGKIGQSVEMVRSNVKAAHFIIPFVRTPLNIFRQGLERTPLAPMSKQWRGDIAAGGHARDLALGRAILGTSIMGAVMSAVSAGLLTGGGDPEDFRRRRRMEAGITPYSIKIGDKWVEYRRLEPLGTIIGAAADAMETSSYAQEDNAEHVMSMVAAAFSQAVTSKTYMKGLSDLVNVLSQPERYGERWYQSFAGSVVPAAVSQFAGRNDTENGRPVVRDVRSMGEGVTGLEDLKQTTANAIKGRLPKTPINPEFNRESLPKRVDTWGETQTSAPGSFPGSPVRVSSPTDDPVRKEANRLGIKMTDIGTKALGVKLNADQLETYSRSSGKLAHEVMTTLVSHPEWSNIPDFAKVKAFEEAIKAGREYGRGIITPEIINKSIEKTLKGIADVEYD